MGKLTPPEIINFTNWLCIIHYDKNNNPAWFSYYTPKPHIGLPCDFTKDLRTFFGKNLEIYDMFGINGEGTGKIRLIP